MSLVRIHNLAVSLDGYSTGEGQSLESPFGHAQESLMQRFFATRFFHQASDGCPENLLTYEGARGELKALGGP